MSKSDYVEVGGILTTKKGKKYECVEELRGCTICDLTKHCLKVKCASHERVDRKDVQFVRRKEWEATKETRGGVAREAQ